MKKDPKNYLSEFSIIEFAGLVMQLNVCWCLLFVFFQGVIDSSGLEILISFASIPKQAWSYHRYLFEDP